MPITRKQKKARKSREVDLLTDIENLVVMLRRNHLEMDDSETSNVIIAEGPKVPVMAHF